MAARARRAVAHLARLALRAGGAPDAAAWAADTDDLPFGVHDADSVEAGAARAGPGGARQRGRRGAGRGRYAERVVCLAGRKDLLQTLLPARALGGAAQVVAASGRLAREDLFHAVLPAAWRHGPRCRRNDSCGKQWERDRREHLSGGHREPSSWGTRARWAPGCLSSTHYHESPREGEGTVAEQASARQRHRDSVNSAVCTDYAPGLRRGAPRDEPGDRRASQLVEGCGVRQPQDESRAAACDDRVPLNRLTQLPRRCDCPIRPRVLEEAKRPALLARGPGGAR